MSVWSSVLFSSYLLKATLPVDHQSRKNLIWFSLLQKWNDTMDQKPAFDLEALVVFAKVVEIGSLSKAAALLDMPKSTVTRKVSRLESQLGEKLLRRSTHRITVTELGERIYGHGLKILSEAHDVSATVEGIRKEQIGRASCRERGCQYV